MTHVPFTSRLASLIGLPSNPSPKHDESDDYYIPYTGTYEMPPSASTHARVRGHTHTLSGSTKTAGSNYSMAASLPHPYNSAYLPSQATATTATFAEEDRGRQRKVRPISNSSSFAGLSPSSEQPLRYPSPKPVLPSNSAPSSSRRMTGTSFIALDGGFIGQSPVATVPTRDRERDGRDTWKSEKAPHRSSLASFMTFGQSRKSIPVVNMPLSAQSTSFPHGASKLRGENRREHEEDSDGHSPSFIQPVLPAFLRQRSQSYVEQTEQGVERRRREEEQQGWQEMEEAEGRRSVRVMAPTSFFDTSPFEERPLQQASYRNNPPVTLGPFQPQPHPYHQHYQPVSVPAISQGVNLASPVNPSFDFPHPYAISAPDVPRSSRSDSMQGTTAPRLVIPPPPQPIPVDHSAVGRPTQYPFPFINPFASEPHQHASSPPNSRPATPKNRLRALASDKLKTLKGSISTPNLRAVARSQQVTNQGDQNQPSNVVRTRAPASMVPPHYIAGNSNWVPPTVVLQGQTICDTFIFPRPRFHAHQISPPDTPQGSATRIPKLVEPDRAPRHIEPEEESWRDQRRATTTTLEPSKPRVMARGAGKKASAPDLRVPERHPSLRTVRRMSEAEKAMLRGEALQRERDEWAQAARKSFQNSRSRSLSRTRTKSIAKAANDAIVTANTSAAAEEQQRERARKMAATSAAPSSVAHTAPGSAPPTAASSVGAHTKDDGHTQHKEKTSNVKSSIDYLAQRAFAQGHVAVVSTSSLHHNRQQSGDTTKENEHGLRRSESWGRSALKRAKNACVDPEAISPAVEKVFVPDVPKLAISTASSQVVPILDIKVPKREKELTAEDEDLTASAVGVAIGTPPLPSLLTTVSARIEHPYATPISSPTRPYVGPHPASPVLTALPPHSLNDVSTRHRLPPHAVISPPRSPQLAPSIAGLDHYLPGPSTARQENLSRESWLVYMSAMEPGNDRLSPVEERSTSKATSSVDEYERQEVPEDVETQRNSPDIRTEETPLRSRIVSPDLEAELTKAFQRHSNASLSDTENEHAELTFQAGATLTRLLSSRSVTATPRPAALRALGNREATEQTNHVKGAPISTGDREFEASALPPQGVEFQRQDSFARIPPVEAVEERPISGDSEALTGSGQDGSWRKSTVSSEGVAQSQESSPKASPRALLNLDDLEGYSDLFYNAGQGSSTSRPRSGSSFKTNNSGDRNRHVDVITFGSRPNDTPSLTKQILSAPIRQRGSFGILWTPTHSPQASSGGEPGGGRALPTSRTNVDVNKTWDPEEDDEPYRIVNPRPPMLPRSIAPIQRHSTKLSVIEGSIDEHATASESTAEDGESVSASSPTRPGLDQGAIHSSGTFPTAHYLLNVPSQTHRRRTSSERAVVPEGFARTSIMTSTSGQSRMSNLSEFPIPPVETADYTLTPSDVLNLDYLPSRHMSSTPVSPLSAEPGSPTAEGSDSDEERDHDSRRSSTSRPFRENRSTFGPDTEVARDWAQRQRELDRSPSPATEER